MKYGKHYPEIRHRDHDQSNIRKVSFSEEILKAISKLTIKLRVNVTAAEYHATKSWQGPLKTSMNKTTRSQDIFSKTKLRLKYLPKETVHA